LSRAGLPDSLQRYLTSLQPSLHTVLHLAAASTTADLTTVSRILAAGAYRSLRTQRGETAHSIAAQTGRPEELLNLLALPPDLLQYREEIGRQEEALHNIIRGRSQFLLHRHGLQLPQISILWEAVVEQGGEGGSSLWFPVPGMYGGFKVELEELGGDLVVNSWVRICGGSEQRHLIHPDGSVTDQTEEVAGTFT